MTHFFFRVCCHLLYHFSSYPVILFPLKLQDFVGFIHHNSWFILKSNTRWTFNTFYGDAVIRSITPTDRGHQVGVIIVTTGFITIIIKAVMGLMLAPDWNVSHSCISGVGHHHHHVSASSNQNDDSVGYLLALIQSRLSHFALLWCFHLCLLL